MGIGDDLVQQMAGIAMAIPPNNIVIGNVNSVYGDYDAFFPFQTCKYLREFSAPTTNEYYALIK